ncbi:hypothetical protein HLB42_20395 (plasmid) [Deinococcus sp. D7000]|nr:hypothetical protein HLB42_20395 [Deinococcus sp. D7000]
MKTAALQLTPAVRAYLRRATWGLPREKQQEVWDELEEHLLTRAAQLQACGTAPPEALSRALAELGSPAQISAGMTGVYLMPKLVLMAAAGALALSAALYALAGGNDGKVVTLPILTMPSPSTLCAPEGSAALQLPVDSRRDKLICYRTAVDVKGNGTLVSLSAVQTAMGVYGGTARVLPDGRLEIRMPDNTWMRTKIVYHAGNESFIRANSLFDALISLRPRVSTTKITLEGYNQPILKLGDQAIQFGDDSNLKLGTGIYGALSGEVISSVIYKNSDDAYGFEQSYALPQSAKHSVQTPFVAGEVVTLIEQRSQNNFFVDTAEVGPGGMVQLRTLQKKLHFVSDSSQLSVAPAGGRTPALLVRVTNIPLNDLKSGIFVPKQITSDASSMP